MTVSLIEKLLSEAVRTGGTYAEFQVSDHKIAFTCDGGSRRSTRNYHRTTSEIKVDERVLKTIGDKNLLFTDQLKRIQVTLQSNLMTYNLCDPDFYRMIENEVTEEEIIIDETNG